MIQVLDASALLIYLEQQEGYEKVIHAFTHAGKSDERLLMSAVNWGEVYYVLVRGYGMDDTKDIMNIIDTLPLDIVSVDESIARQAALYKAQKKLPYVDSFAAALARLYKAELLTADKDFKEVEKDIKILWL